jgi:hypothetical protein
VCKRREQLAAYQVTAKDKEKIDTDPAETIDSPGQFESEKRRVINDDYDDGERSEKIETGLTFAICEARIDFELFPVSLRSERHYRFRVGDAARIETRSFPKSLAATRRRFTFYLDDPITSIDCVINDSSPIPAKSFD